MPLPGPQAFSKTFLSVMGCLSRSRVRYCLIGALTLGVWGASRATQDIDCLLLLNEKQRADLDRLLRRRGFVPDARWAEQNPLLRDGCVRYRKGLFPVDLLFPRDPFDHKALSRRRRKQLHGKSVWVVGPEDLILLKLKAGRPRDFDDILSVVGRQKSKLDEAYLKDWAKRLGLWEELMYCLTQAQAPG